MAGVQTLLGALGSLRSPWNPPLRHVELRGRERKRVRERERVRVRVRVRQRKR